MTTLLIGFSLLAYAVAALLLWRERAWRAPLMLFAGSLAVLSLPFWMLLYRAVPGQNNVLSTFGVEVGEAAIFGGPLVALPALLFCAGMGQRWWPRHYALVWLGYISFVLYFFLIGWIVVEEGIVPALSLLGLNEDVVVGLLILLMAGVSLGIVYVTITSRDYAAFLAFLAIIISGIFGTLLFWGLLGAPLWATWLLGLSTIPRWVALVLAGACAILVLWGVHLVASVLHAGRRRGFAWN